MTKLSVDGDDELEYETTCDECEKNLTYNHSAKHLKSSLIESANFEYSLNVVIRKTAKELNIDKEDAMNIILEQIRDEMRKDGFDTFNLSRSEVIDEEDDN